MERKKPHLLKSDVGCRHYQFYIITLDVMHAPRYNMIHDQII